MMRRSSLPEPVRRTIMNQELAAAHGSNYVDLAAFAIDIDRVYWLDPDDARLPLPSPEHAILSVR